MDTVLLTGASGGFGVEFARALEQRGYALILHGRDAKRLHALKQQLFSPDKHPCIIADLSQPAGITSLLEQLGDRSISGLVNNAGFGLWGAFAGLPLEDQLTVLHTDLLAPVTLTHTLLPRLTRASGFIINVSSLAGEYPLPYMSTYAAAKGGLTLWSEALRSELAGTVRVVTLAPGPSPTGFRAVSGMPHGPGRFFRTSAADIVKAALAVLDAGGGYCVPGVRHRLLWLMQRTIPHRFGLEILKKKLAPRED